MFLEHHSSLLNSLLIYYFVNFHDWLFSILDGEVLETVLH